MLYRYHCKKLYQILFSALTTELCVQVLLDYDGLLMSAGFGSIARHFKQLACGLEGALDADAFSKQALQLLQLHSPAI